MPAQRSFPRRALDEGRGRLPWHGLAFLVAWPLFSAVCGALPVNEQVVSGKVPWGKAFAGMFAAAAYLWAEFLAIGALLALASTALFALAAAAAAGSAPPPARSRLALLLEPLVFGAAATLGTALVYPVVLRHPALQLLRPLPVWAATLTLGLAVAAVAGLAGWRLGRLRGAAAVLAALAAVALATRGAAAHMPMPQRQAGSNGIVLLGIDSIAQADDLTPLRALAARYGGVEHTRAVSPGTVTNTVWWAILLHRPIHENGVFFAGQTADWRRAPYHLPVRARAAGLVTHSFFSDQFTTYVGTRGGFDVDRSGPLGALQVGTAGVKDGSILLPLARRWLRALPFAPTPANQSGTFCFDVERELVELFTAGAGRPALAAAHLDYLHQAHIPAYFELDPSLRRKMRNAAVRALTDFSIDWQIPPMAEDPLGLYDWKLRRVQEHVAAAAERTGLLDPARRNKLIVFSDHGRRLGMTYDTFGIPSYYHVPLITFGTAAADPTAPISLIDIGPLAGLDDPTQPAPSEPVVEHAVATEEEWFQLVATSELRRDGEIVLDPVISARVGRRLRAFRPYGPERGYFLPVRKAAVRP